MNILFFASIDFYHKPNPSFHLMKAMFEDLIKAGHTIYFVGLANNEVDKHIPDCFMDNPSFHYGLIPYTPAPKNAFARRYLEGISLAFRGGRIMKKMIGECDVVFLQSTPTMLYNALVARHYARKKPIIMNMMDMFPGSSIASGIMPKRWMQKVFFELQKIAYKKVDVIVGISEDMRDKLMEQGVPYEKTRVILNWFDDNTVSEVPRADNRFIKKHNMSEDKFYVQYAGTMGYVFDYKIVLQVAEQLMPYDDIVIQMIGIGSQKDDFIKEASERGLTNIHFLPLEPQEIVADVYSACDVCYIPLKHGIIGNSVPSKAGLLMACKRAIITSVDKGSKYAKEINENQLGFACPDDDPKAVVEAILYLYNNRSECKSMGLRGYDFGYVKYSRTENMRLFNELFNSFKQ